MSHCLSFQIVKDMKIVKDASAIENYVTFTSNSYSIYVYIGYIEKVFFYTTWNPLYKAV